LLRRWCRNDGSITTFVSNRILIAADIWNLLVGQQARVTPSDGLGSAFEELAQFFLAPEKSCSAVALGSEPSIRSSASEAATNLWVSMGRPASWRDCTSSSSSRKVAALMSRSPFAIISSFANYFESLCFNGLALANVCCKSQREGCALGKPAVIQVAWGDSRARTFCTPQVVASR
jgi:hypothetical protein